MAISKYHRFMQFTRTVSVLDMRGDEETRKIRAARFERKNKTRGKRSVFKAPGRWWPETHAPVAHYGWAEVDKVQA